MLIYGVQIKNTNVLLLSVSNGFEDLPNSSCCVLCALVCFTSNKDVRVTCSRAKRQRAARARGFCSDAQLRSPPVPRTLPLPSLAIVDHSSVFLATWSDLSCAQVIFMIIAAIAARPKLIQERKDRVSRPWHDEGEMDGICGMFGMCWMVLLRVHWFPWSLLIWVIQLHFMDMHVPVCLLVCIVFAVLEPDKHSFP